MASLFTSSTLPAHGQVWVQFGYQKLQVRVDDLTIKTIAKIFRLMPDTVILMFEEGTVAIPDDNGKFDFLV